MSVKINVNALRENWKMDDFVVHNILDLVSEFNNLKYVHKMGYRFIGFYCDNKSQFRLTDDSLSKFNSIKFIYPSEIVKLEIVEF